MSERRNFWMRWRVRLGYPLAIIYWILARPTPHSIVYGGLIAAFGLIIRALAAGHLVKYQELATSGPYAATRNPLYFGSSLLAAGFAIAGRSWIGGGLIAVYFGVVYYAVMRNEEQELRAKFGAIFDEYASRVPLFFPRPPHTHSAQRKSDDPSAKEFSWAQYLRNRETQALVGTVLALTAVWLRTYAPIALPGFLRH
ncbi:MAG TPA: isoprenylcysteine carboxylmethyltransferase family protein [Verrucomicrobiae bacterium]|nr:isoprenylcysteine carboxylmethyltransferase family protein [Verrucomicrobiae bacterium]